MLRLYRHLFAKNRHTNIHHLMTAEEQRLSAQWPVAGLPWILEEPEAASERYAEGLVHFHEQAGHLMRAFPQGQDSSITVRFGVGGLWLAPRNFSLKEESLLALWQQERPMVDWINAHRNAIEAAAQSGRAYALAKSALDIVSQGGPVRSQALAQGFYDVYLRQVYWRGFNQFGLNPCQSIEPFQEGIDPWLQVARKIQHPIFCNGHQLQYLAESAYLSDDIPYEVYSILKNLPFVFSPQERNQEHDWADLLHSRLVFRRMGRVSGGWIAEALDFLDDACEAQLSYSDP